MNSIFTVGHSNDSLDHLVELLRARAIGGVVDIRTIPRSGYRPEFNEESLNARLNRERIAYQSRGSALGSHPREPQFYYKDGRVNFELIAERPAFKHAIEDLATRRSGPALALLCSEGEPLECPRFFLIGRVLAGRGVEVVHILRDGSAETQSQAEQRMLKVTRLENPDLFATPDELLDSAYEELRHAYKYRRGD